MLLQISKSFTNYLLNKAIIESSKKDLLIYGFQLTLSTSASIITILTLSYFYNIIYGIIFLGFFFPLRFYAGGYHAHTFQKCFIYTNTCFIGILLFSYAALQYNLLDKYFFFAIVSIFYLWLITPCINQNNPLSEKEIIKNRMNTRILLLLYTFMLIALHTSYPFVSLIGFNTLFLVSILFIIGNLENKYCSRKGVLL